MGNYQGMNLGNYLGMNFRLGYMLVIIASVKSPFGYYFLVMNLFYETRFLKLSACESY